MTPLSSAGQHPADSTDDRAERGNAGEDRRHDPSHQARGLIAKVGSEPMLERLKAMVQRFEVERDRLARHQIAPATGRSIHEDRGSFDAVRLFKLTAQPCSGLFDGRGSLPNVRVRQGAIGIGSEPTSRVPLGSDSLFVREERRGVT
jgi:hypothetical protein